jgi:hypothetical protein
VINVRVRSLVELHWPASADTGIVRPARAFGTHASRALAQWVTHLLLMVLCIAAGIAVIEWLAIAHMSQWLGATAETYQRAGHFIAIVLPCSVLAAAMQMCADAPGANPFTTGLSVFNRRQSAYPLTAVITALAGHHGAGPDARRARFPRSAI